MIDGGKLSVITPNTVYYSNFANSGTITSASAAATINILPNGSFGLSKSGTIVNTGSGTALSGTLSLVKQGTINGSVYAGGISTAECSLSTINGNVCFGSSGDTIVATLVSGAFQAGFTDTITAPVGANTLQIDTTIDSRCRAG